jgi:hypothetical protein
VAAGTGIRISRTSMTPGNRLQVAEVLSQFGCPPQVALRAADRILAEGCYETRVGTATAVCGSLRDFLEASGLEIHLESVKPEGNADHATDERYRRQQVRSRPYPADIVRAMLAEAAEAEHALQAGPRF